MYTLFTLRNYSNYSRNVFFVSSQLNWTNGCSNSDETPCIIIQRQKLFEIAKSIIVARFVLHGRLFFLFSIENTFFVRISNYLLSDRSYVYVSIRSISFARHENSRLIGLHFSYKNRKTRLLSFLRYD